MRLEAKLREAGLHSNPYARQIMAAVPPPQPPRRDMESTVFKFDWTLPAYKIDQIMEEELIFAIISDWIMTMHVPAVQLLEMSPLTLQTTSIKEQNRTNISV